MITKYASQPFASDPSVWKISVTDADTAKLAGVNIKVTLVQGGDIKIAWSKNTLIILPGSPFQS